MELTDDTRIDLQPDSFAHVAVPVGLAVVTWLVVLITVGLLARFGSVSILGIISVLVVGVMLWPIAIVAPWRPGVTERVLDWGDGNRTTFGVAVLLLVLRSLPVTPGIVAGILDVPFRSAGTLFDAKLFYAQHVAPAFGQFVLSFGQWYLELFWLFVLAEILVRIVRGFR